MVLFWIKKRRRTELLAEPFPGEWREILKQNVRHYAYLDEYQLGDMHRFVQIFTAEKTWVGGAGFMVTAEMKVTIAGQAALLVLDRDEPYYFDGVQSIIIYPGSYRRPSRSSLGPRTEYVHVPLGGEAWYRGPIVLSWDFVLRAGRNTSGGKNLVLHEFAHYLDGLDGDVDGDPPLAGREQRRRWYDVTEAEYLRLIGQSRRNEVSLLDQYGASNRAEFFAVAVECFFEQPHAMQAKHAELYELLADYFEQDPVDWLPDAAPLDEQSDRKAAEAARKTHLAALRSTSADTLFTLSVQYYQEGRYRLAAAAATRAIRLNRRDGEAYQQRAAARVKQGRYRRALADIRRALRWDPEDAASYRIRGAAFFGLGKLRSAFRDLNIALADDPHDAEALNYRGRVWAAVGKWRKAVEDFDKSLASHPLVAEVHYHRGLAHRALGNERDAEVDLAKAFQLDPGIDQRREIQPPDST